MTTNKQLKKTIRFSLILSLGITYLFPLATQILAAFQPIRCDGDGVLTGFGCLPTLPWEFANEIREILLAAGSGIAMLLMILGSFFVLTSQGNPDRLKKGKEIFSGAIIGLLFMIFSTFIFQFITVDLLGIFTVTP